MWGTNVIMVTTIERLISFFVFFSRSVMLCIILPPSPISHLPSPLYAGRRDIHTRPAQVIPSAAGYAARAWRSVLSLCRFRWLRSSARPNQPWFLEQRGMDAQMYSHYLMHKHTHTHTHHRRCYLRHTTTQQDPHPPTPTPTPTRIHTRIHPDESIAWSVTSSFLTKHVIVCADKLNTTSTKGILNVASGGFFSSDRTISDYAESIWDADPCPVDGDSQM